VDLVLSTCFKKKPRATSERRKHAESAIGELMESWNGKTGAALLGKFLWARTASEIGALPEREAERKPRETSPEGNGKGSRIILRRTRDASRGKGQSRRALKPSGTVRRLKDRRALNMTGRRRTKTMRERRTWTLNPGRDGAGGGEVWTDKRTGEKQFREAK